MGKSKKENEELSPAEQSSFEDDMLAMGFDMKTVQVLGESGFKSVSDLTLLAEEEGAVNELSLPMAQRLLLKRHVKTMRKPEGRPNDDVSELQVNTQAGGQAAGTKLGQVLGELKQDGQTAAALVTAGVSQQHSQNPASQGDSVNRTSNILLSSSDGATTQAADPQIYLRGGCDPRNLKVHEIVDYIHLIPPVVEEQVVSEQGEAQFIYRNAPRKPKLQTISVEEWCLANTRIMDILLTTNQLNELTLKDYMCYTMKVCELFKCYQRPSVLQYDREYRHLQARHNFRWGTDCPHLHTLHLRLKPLGSMTTAGPAGRNQGQKRHGQNVPGRDQICFQYNSRQGCSYGESCRFKHGCSEPGCTASHSKVDHQARGSAGHSQTR